METARESAAVILFRERNGGSEIFLGQRHGRATFASTFVFPGGLVDAEDATVHEYCLGVDLDTANQRLSLVSGGLNFYSAAIRELFEETGVLLARDRAGSWVSEKTPEQEALPQLRASLTAGDVSWLEVLSTCGARLASDELHYVGHWETPLALSARFSTRFFLAELPPDQTPEHDGEELIDSRWLQPAKALELNRSGEIDLPFPQLKHMEILAELGAPKKIRQWAHDRWQKPIKKVRPWMSKENDQRRFILPGERDYPDHA